MTLLLETKSHGIVEAGFYATFMQFSRLGEYTFATRHLCDLIQFFAENNNTKTKLLGYNLDKFWEGNTTYHQKVVRFMLEQAGKSTLPALKKANLEKRLEQWQTEILVGRGNNDVSSKGRIVPVVVTEQEKAIHIGEYEISSTHFGRMAHYLTHGGFFGWSGKKPPFAEATMRAIRNSDRKLYQEIRQELEASHLDPNLN